MNVDEYKEKLDYVGLVTAALCTIMDLTEGFIPDDLSRFEGELLAYRRKVQKTASTMTPDIALDALAKFNALPAPATVTEDKEQADQLSRINELVRFELCEGLSRYAAFLYNASLNAKAKGRVDRDEYKKRISSALQVAEGAASFGLKPMGILMKQSAAELVDHIKADPAFSKETGSQARSGATSANAHKLSLIKIKEGQEALSIYAQIMRGRAENLDLKPESFPIPDAELLQNLGIKIDTIHSIASDMTPAAIIRLVQDVKSLPPPPSLPPEEQERKVKIISAVTFRSPALIAKTVTATEEELIEYLECFVEISILSMAIAINDVAVSLHNDACRKIRDSSREDEIIDEPGYPLDTGTYKM